VKSNNIQRGVVSPEFNPPISANLLRKAARAAKERQKRWISNLFILVDRGPVARNDVQAVALSNFDGGGPTAALEEGAELKNISVCVTSKGTTHKWNLK
jgi:hypothetical protein